MITYWNMRNAHNILVRKCVGHRYKKNVKIKTFYVTFFLNFF